MKNMGEKRKIVAITGPTATGKTALAVNLAKKFDGEILSADSRQVYTHLDLGSGKDREEYGKVPVHLLDVAEPGSLYNLAEFCFDAAKALERIQQRGKLPILCGGSPLYLDAILRSYQLPGTAPDPAERAILDQMSLEELNATFAREFPAIYAGFQDRTNHNRLRRQLEIARSGSKNSILLPELDALVLGVYYPRNTVRQRIEERLDARFAMGMINEVQQLHDQYHVSWERLEFFGLEYREIALYLQGKCDFDTMRSTLLNKIRQFAKRQDIFFRKLEREGVIIHWLPGAEAVQRAEELIQKFLDNSPLPPPEIQMMNINYKR